MSGGSQQLFFGITTDGPATGIASRSAGVRRVPQIAIRRQQLFGSAAPISSLAKYAQPRTIETAGTPTYAETPIEGAKTLHHDGVKESPLQYPLHVPSIDTSLDEVLQLRLKAAQRQVVTLKEQLAQPRIATSEACNDLINFMMSTRDTMVPSVWGKAPPAEREIMGSSSSAACCTIS